MLDFPAPKTMAKALRGALAEREIFVSHGQCLDLVAKQLGFADWNVLSARLETVMDPGALILPKGWATCGRFASGHFRVGATADLPGVGMAEAVEGAAIPADAFAGLMQSISAQAYLGKRLRLSAELKGRDAGAGTIWLRIDAPGHGRTLGFDNMMMRDEDGPVSGHTDWTERSIVLDVPEEAESIYFGFFLKAPGAVWARGFRLETVGEDVPVTGGRGLPPGPTNLDFQ